MPNLSANAFFIPSRTFVATIFAFLYLSITSVYSQWEIIDSKTKVNMRGVHTVTPTICWIGGSSGTVLRTINGGKDWSVFKIPGADSLDFRDIHAFGKETAIAMSAGPAELDKGKIYRTENGGDTWSLVYQTTQSGVFLDGIDFWNKSQGICLGDPINGKLFILTTEDGGKSWQELPIEDRPQAQSGEACFAASGTSILAVGKDKAFIGTGGGKMARVFRSEDMGRHWQVSETPMPAGPTSGIFGLHFWSKKNGIAVGGDYKNTSDTTRNVLLTDDGGVTWKFGASTKPIGLKEAVALYHKRYATWNGDSQIRSDDFALVAVGPSGSSSSTKQGKSWQTIGNEPFHAVSFAGNVGYAVGGKGLIAKIEKVSMKKKRKKLVFVREE
ncbi:YCF48-related protein [Dyadobacter sp. CY345]|uniref:WD40/YVTN/BNR-like repeat-containing protein n=1 Tax=Dyadobacter sp. CY345 TaxID=2909335 RepID=UPI001F32C622|nr:YCF48-related protein [Dyadobacter sp. CY345]MCF2446174.1 YCF48-related protein [Dyadobacter sp. CY345]